MSRKKRAEDYVKPKQRRHKIADGFVFWLILYPCALLLALAVNLLRLVGLITVIHYERLPRWEGRILLVPNHPSMYETILLPALFWFQYLFHPRRFTPWSTPDIKLLNRWFLQPFRQRFILVPRGDRRGSMRALVEMIKVLRMNHILILFPEGGRTYKGTVFYYSASGKYRIRELSGGVGRIIEKTGATVVPVWVQNTEKVLPNNGTRIPRLWHPVVIKIGQPIRFSDPRVRRKKETIPIITDALLRLADEAG